MDNDALDSMDELERAVFAAFERLRGLAPAAIENRVGGRDTRRGGRVLAAHHADEDIDRGAGMAARN